MQREKRLHIEVKRHKLGEHRGCMMWNSIRVHVCPTTHFFEFVSDSLGEPGKVIYIS